jgi:TetR/AcrR family transcriptional repressor of nem operon
MARPREFDEETVLAAAVDAFWTSGYEATSTRDLVKRTGLAQPSLYNAFGDKRNLFRRALEAYSKWTVRDKIIQLESTFSPGRALVAYFNDVIESTMTDTLRRGCLLVNTTLYASPRDDDLTQWIAGDIEEIREFLERCVGFGQQRGELTTVVSPRMAADHLLCLLLGMRVLAKINPDAASLSAAVAAAFAAIGLNALPAMDTQGTSDQV